MKYIPPRTDIKLRAIYSALLIGAIICFFPQFEGIVRTVMQSVGILLITASLALFIKYESTTFSYIILEKNGRFDFYVNKQIGKRGSYVCYFPLTDAVKIVKKDDKTKDLLRKEYKDIFFYNYAKNVFCGDKYVIVFSNEDRYDAVIIEPDNNFVSLITEKISKNDNETDE